MNKFNNFITKNINAIYISSVLLLSTVFMVFIRFKLNFLYKNYDVSKTIFLMSSYISVFIILIIGISLAYYYFLRKSIKNFSDKISDSIDNIIYKNENIEFDIYEESITSRIENKLKQLLEVVKNEKLEYIREKESIKTLISDISHQIKTPIANISIYNETLIERDLDESQQKLCLNNMKYQVDKLEWLVKCLIKMSRLENKIINLNKSRVKLIDILTNSLSGIYIKAQDKNIDINLNCDENIMINCDNKWTTEAIFNILENAVKYTNFGGNIDISVEELEMFIKVDIKDNGIGIDKGDINNIFKRFFRCSEANEVEGVGIGLYLSREIISKQGGYIKVKSIKGEGSLFSIYVINN